jgi:hypothetical protein
MSKKMAVVVVGDDEELRAGIAAAVEFGLGAFGFTNVVPMPTLGSSREYVDVVCAPDSQAGVDKLENLFDALAATRPKMFETEILLDSAPGHVSTSRETQLTYSFNTNKLELDNLQRMTESRDAYPVPEERSYGSGVEMRIH